MRKNHIKERFSIQLIVVYRADSAEAENSSFKAASPPTTISGPVMLLRFANSAFDSQVISSAVSEGSKFEGYSLQECNLFYNSSAVSKTNKKKNSKKLKANLSKIPKEIVKETKLKSSTSVKEPLIDNVLAKRIPVIHVEGSKENPISTQIINSIKSEDDDVSDGKTAAKRKLAKNDLGWW